MTILDVREGYREMMQTTSSGLKHREFDERPRERLFMRGASALSTAELLAVCLGSGCAGMSALQLAQNLLVRFGNLDALLQARADELRQCHGMGPARVAQIKALAELTLRHSESQLREPDARDAMTDVTTVSRYVQRQIGAARREIFACLFLDARHRLLHFETLFLGSVNRAHVYPREVLRQALEHNAAAVILAHNHPSGVAEPSQADISLTAELRALLARVDVKVLDHIVVAQGQVVSFAARGLIQE